MTAGNALGLAAHAVREKVLALGAELLEVSVGDLVLEDGKVHVRGAPGRELSLGALATAANPIRYAYGKEANQAALQLVKPRSGAVLEPGEEPGLEAFRYFAPERATWASGQHAAIVEIDLATGNLTFVRYVVVHDCGVVINPTIVEGQIHGGVAQGIGGAFYEKLHFDDSGQLLNASFMDFLIPTSAEIPEIEIAHIETPSPLNPLGVKGVGEAGTIPVAAAVAEAIEDALGPFGVRIREMPLSPARLRELFEEAQSTVLSAGAIERFGRGGAATRGCVCPGAAARARARRASSMTLACWAEWPMTPMRHMRSRVLAKAAGDVQVELVEQDRRGPLQTRRPAAPGRSPPTSGDGPESANWRRPKRVQRRLAARPRAADAARSAASTPSSTMIRSASRSA